MKTKPSTPPQEVRLTIPVSAAVHQTFARIAKAANMPVGRAMGEWLGDTMDAANFMAETMEKARSAPALVAKELHAYALGLGDETQELMRTLREKSRAPVGDKAKAEGGTTAGRSARRSPGDRCPPSGNTGGKVPKPRPGKPGVRP